MAIWSDLLARAGAKAKARGRIAINAGRRHAVAVAGTHTDGTTSVLPSPSFTGESAAIQALAWQQAQPGRWAGSVVLHPMDYRILQLDAPKVPEAERRDALRWLMRDQIDFAIEDASIDGVEVPGPSLGTRSDKIIAVVAPAERIRDWMQRYRQQRCALETIDIPEFAMRNLAVLATGQSAAALVHIGLRVTRVTIVWQQELCAFRQLELSARQLADATEPERLAILDRLALDIQRTADAFTRQFHGADLKKLLLSSLAQVELVQERLIEMTGLDVQRFRIEDHVNWPAGHAVFDLKQELDYTLAVGAALRPLAH